MEDWKTISADLANLRARFIFLEFRRCTRIELTTLEKPPPGKRRWGLRGDAGGNTISGSKYLWSVVMFMVVLGKPTRGPSGIGGRSLYAIYLSICLSIYQSMAS